MERYYNIAGLDICIKGRDEEMYTNEYRLQNFAAEKKEPFQTYHFSIVDTLEESCGICIHQDSSKRIYQDYDRKIQYIGVVKTGIEGAYIRCETLGNTTNVQIKRKDVPKHITSKVVLTSLGIETLVSKASGFILHASFINVNGKAILFTAPSKTGKSTQAELWSKLRGAEIINGDRAIVRINNGNFEACGLPFSGSSEYCKNVSIPLAAIIYLEQAPETTISSFGGAKAFRKIWEQLTIPVWDRTEVEEISSNLTLLLSTIPVYRLSCTPDETAVIALEEALGKKG